MRGALHPRPIESKDRMQSRHTSACALTPHYSGLLSRDANGKPLFPMLLEALSRAARLLIRRAKCFRNYSLISLGTPPDGEAAYDHATVGRGYRSVVVMMLVAGSLGVMQAGCGGTELHTPSPRVEDPVLPARQAAHATHPAQPQPAPPEAPLSPLLFHPGSDPRIEHHGLAESRAARLPGALTLDFEDAPLAEITHTVLSEMLARDYVLESAIPGRATLRTSRPVDGRQLLALLENLLAANGMTLAVSTHGVVHVGVKSQWLKERPGHALRLGYNVLVVPLRFISAEQAVELLDPFTDETAILWADNATNLMMLSGTQGQLAGWLDVLQTFDVDFLSGMSVGLIPLHHADTSAIQEELALLLANLSERDGDAQRQSLVRIMPIAHLNSLLVIVPRRHMLGQVTDWIERLDISTHAPLDRQLFVYPLQNARAEEVADQLRGIYPTDHDAPVRIVADSIGNRLVAHTDYQGFSKIAPVLARLDAMPPQILIEISILEVALTGEFRHGVHWAFNHAVGGDHRAIAQLQPGDGFDPAGGPGFSYSILNSNGDVRATLNLLAQRSQVNMLSNPSVLVQNNRTASMHIGDQVATPTQRTTTDRYDESADEESRQGTELVSFEYRDTGIRLTVKPSISASGLISMDLDQAVTDLGPADRVSENLTAHVFSERRIVSRLFVRSGQSVVLGGLIKENKLNARAGVPWLSRIPGFAPLFSYGGRRAQRTELLIVVTPRLVASEPDLRALHRELRSQLWRLRPE